MSIKYRNASGQEVVVSGLTPGGDIEAGAIMTRTGTQTFSLSTNQAQQYTIVFDSDLPDENYIVTFEFTTDVGDIVATPALQTTSGFKLWIHNVSAASRAGTLKWTATKTYTVQHAAQNAEDITNIKAVIPSTASSTNQLAPKKYVDDADTALDGRVSDLEDLIPTGASVTNQLTTKAEMDKVYTKTEVDTKLDDKQDTLTFDNEPIAGSSNPVKSNGIKDALNDIEANIDNVAANIYEVIGKNGAKNLLGLSKIATSESKNGVTLTKNSDGSFTLNGTATMDTFFKLLTDFPTSGNYIFSGMDTGSYNNTYWIWLGNISNGNMAFYQGKAIYSDTKDSTPFDITQLKTGSDAAITIDNLCVWITVKNSTTFSNKIIYPMIRLASDPDNTYQSYAMTNSDLTNKLKFKNSSSFADAYDKALLFVNIGIVFTISNISHAVTQLIPKGLATGNLRFVMGGGDVYCQIQIDTTVSPPTVTNAYASYRGSQITIDQIVYTYI